MTILTTERLTLRHLTMGDAEALHDIHHEPGVWTHFQGTPPASVDDERAKIEEQLAHYREHGFGGWATVWRETGELIGRCGLRAQVIDGRAETELGYLISPRFRAEVWRRKRRAGFATMRLRRSAVRASWLSFIPTMPPRSVSPPPRSALHREDPVQRN